MAENEGMAILTRIEQLEHFVNHSLVDRLKANEDAVKEMSATLGHLNSDINSLDQDLSSRVAPKLAVLDELEARFLTLEDRQRSLAEAQIALRMTLDNYSQPSPPPGIPESSTQYRAQAPEPPPRPSPTAEATPSFMEPGGASTAGPTLATGSTARMPDARYVAPELISKPSTADPWAQFISSGGTTGQPGAPPNPILRSSAPGTNISEHGFG